MRNERKLANQGYVGKFCLCKESMYIFYRETEKGKGMTNNLLNSI